MSTINKQMFEDLQVGTQFSYPGEQRFTFLMLDYHNSTLTVHKALRQLPGVKDIYTWNKVLVIVEIDTDNQFAIGLYQSDSAYYYVLIYRDVDAEEALSEE